MDTSVKNFLYRNPQYYDIVFPDADEATAKMCLLMFSKYLGNPPASILDVGCGTGRQLDALSRTCSDCLGVDFLPEMIDYAKKVRPHLNLQVGDMRSFRLGRTFDCIVCLGSAFTYALSNEDAQKTLETFAAHSHKGTLLILDIRNGAPILDGQSFKERIETEVNTPQFSAKTISIHSLDRTRQILTRRRTWNISGQSPEEDFCQYRLYFPAELEHLLNEKGFKVSGIFDNRELKETDLSGSRLYVAAVYTD